MSNKKQTSIEWLVEQWAATQGTLYSSDLEQAKELHRQEIINAWNNGVVNWDSCKDAEQYYKDTYETDN